MTDAHDTPEAALAVALTKAFPATAWPDAPDPVDDAAAILAAMPNWRLIPAVPVDAERLRWAKWIVDFGKFAGPDWACAECRPESDMLVDGFVCCYHEAIAALAPAPSEP